MYKVLLVDDDVEMLQGLISFINWEEYGFTVSGTARNGFEALNLVSKHMPDLIITDITMPTMDGLNLIREAKKFKPDLKSIFVSCHEEFDYAREAIHLEADAYLLKHTLTEKSLIDGIEKIKTKLTAQSVEKQRFTQAIQGLSQNRITILEKIFEDIIDEGILNKDELEQRAKAAGIVLPSGGFEVLAFFADDVSERTKHSIARQYGPFVSCILNLIDSVLENTCAFLSFYLSPDTFMVLLWDLPPALKSKQGLCETALKCQNNVNSSLGIMLSACIGNRSYTLERLKDAVDELESLRNAYFYSGVGMIVTQKPQYKLNDLSEIYKKYAPSLKQAVTSNDIGRLFELSEQLLAHDFEEYQPAALKTMLGRLLVEMALNVDSYDISIELLQIKGSTFQTYQKAFRNTVQYMIEKMKHHIIRISHQEVVKALEYMSAHISDNISCEGTAAYVNMNASYFSRLFKRETGLNFSDYLTNKRMQVATELLTNSDCSIEDIANSVGIESVSYFYRAYKKTTGNTPGDVRSRSNISLNEK